ncbi:MAG: DEAD/DEAH box helicase [Promethearchaeota archaeon]
MNLKKLELTFIPSEYWNESPSKFELLSKGKKLPKNAHFFLFWIPSINSEQELINQILSVFPKIPASKLLSCKINLALPLPFLKIKSNNDDNNNKYFGITTVLGKIVPISPAIKLLYNLELIESQDRSITHYSNSIKTWGFLTKLIFELLNKGQFVPILKPLDGKLFEAQWQLLLTSQNDNERFQSILKSSDWKSFNLPINFISNDGTLITDGLWHPSYIFTNYIDSIGDYVIRSILKKTKFSTFKEFYSTEIKKESDPSYKIGWDYKFLKSLIKNDPRFEIKEYYETVIPTIIKNWVQSARGFTFKHGSFFTLKLQYPKKSEEEWPLVFFISLQEDSTLISLKEIWEGNIKKESKFQNLFDNDESYIETILRALGTISKIFPPIKRMLEEKFPGEIKLTSTEVIEFLKYPKDLLIQSGFNVILPDAFSIGGAQRLTARLLIRSGDTEKYGSKSTQSIPSLFDMSSMLEFKWEANLGGEKISDDEFKKLINSNQPLINLRDKWILIDQYDLEELRNAKDLDLDNYVDALKLGLTGSIQLGENGNRYEVIVEGVFGEIIDQLKSIDTFEKIPPPSSFHGTLRPYQEIALSWMGNMCKFNFGLCLADDMGLGKTIQVIALLLHLKEIYPNEQFKFLIVCPTSLLFNWSRELNKFAPDLRIIIHHGSNRLKDAIKITKNLENYEILLTSYGTIRNDIEFLQIIPFSGIIIDESQNIKNYSSQQTQSILKLQGNFRIGLSGTPLENRLMELWTLFEFLNPGLLGTRTEFQKNYIIPIERFQDEEVIDKLKLIISPFMMRRVKTDKSIINDLPDKNEMKIFIELTEQQVILYQEIVDNTFKEFDRIKFDNQKKRGLILGLLVKLKQICNHPFQYLKEDLKSINNEGGLENFLSQSQKVERLLEITEEVIANGEKILIFTQFRQMGDILYKVLSLKYDFTILYFHGSVPEKKRREIVDEFQSDEINSSPILILSLKAGGTGLNLTQGTTVIHIDRWWNPAVEDQATDRAYRIGQKSKVNVYKFITIGTLEEKIDLLLEEKRDLADKIVSSKGESWISDLDEEKLKNLLLLSN